MSVTVSRCRRKRLLLEMSLSLSLLGGIDTFAATEGRSFIQLVAGDRHTCGLTATGQVSCWGANDRGQLGAGNTGGSSVPVDVPRLENVQRLAAAGTQTCAVLQDGNVRCWGSDGEGLETAIALSSFSPVEISGLSSIQDLALGLNHACFLLRNLTLHCQGSNLQGQLGDINFGPTLASGPGDTGLTGLQVVAGSRHTCLLSDQGMVQCWGAYMPERGSYRPERLSGIWGIRQLAAGSQFTCGLLEDGRVFCWGSDEFGQLGNGSLPSQGRIVAANGITDAVAVAAGGYHACAVLQGGSVRCWGANLLGQLGIGSTQSYPIPAQVEGISSAIGITAGQTHTCALLDGGEVRCWGYNASGQLGNGTQDSAFRPVGVLQ